MNQKIQYLFIIGLIIGFGICGFYFPIFPMIKPPEYSYSYIGYAQIRIYGYSNITNTSEMLNVSGKLMNYYTDTSIKDNFSINFNDTIYISNVSYIIIEKVLNSQQNYQLGFNYSTFIVTCNDNLIYPYINEKWLIAFND